MRNSKTVNGSTTNYIWSGQNIVSENTENTNTYYFYGLNRVSRKIMGATYEGLNEDWDNNDNLLYSYAYDGLLDYYLYDGHGSVVQTYDPDRNSQVTVHYGATANSTNFVPELDYSGNSWIDLSDLNYYNSAYPIVDNYYYDPFGELEAAPAFDSNPFRYCGEYWDSESGEIYLRARYYNPRTGRFNRIDPVRDGVNWYVYCWNNPIMNIDPSGLVITRWDLDNCTNDEIRQLERNTAIWNNGTDEQKRQSAESSRAIRSRHLKPNETLLDNGYVEERFESQQSGTTSNNSAIVKTTVTYIRTYDEKYAYVKIENVQVNISTNSGFMIDSMEITTGQSFKGSARTNISSNITKRYSYSPNWDRVVDDGGAGLLTVGVAVTVTIKRPMSNNIYFVVVHNNLYCTEYINDGGTHSDIDPFDVLGEALQESAR